MASTYAAMVFLLGVIAIVLTALFIFFQSPQREETEAVAKRVYKIRTLYFFILLAVLVSFYAFTLPKAPYFRPHDDVVVKVVGEMWLWRFEPVKGARLEGNTLVLPAGKIVEFEVTADDVNHGFGIYDSKGRLLTQAQAMPGYVNHMSYVFKEPGNYKVFCMEFCGIGHHNMFADIKVVKEG